MEKLQILGDAAKYDASCVSSGSSRANDGQGLGQATASGICHSWTGDGRCVSLFKILFTNRCIYDCAYCVNRVSADRKRTAFTVEEVIDLTMNFYKRNFIEGLFLSSGIWRSPDWTMIQLCRVARELREIHHFRGYIHLKAIPGADPALIRRAGLYADRMSVNIELPTEISLNTMAPQKKKEHILGAMGFMDHSIRENVEDKKRLISTPEFIPAGQSTQLIVGATPETDYQILNLTNSLYRKFQLRRVFYSAYMEVNPGKGLSPEGILRPPLEREHRLYQADWLLRFYHFDVKEIFAPGEENLAKDLDPKTNWALNNLDRFPVEVNRADYEELLRVPGIGVLSARKIVAIRRECRITFDLLKKLGITLKRARFFLTCGGRHMDTLGWDKNRIKNLLIPPGREFKQGELFA